MSQINITLEQVKALNLFELRSLARQLNLAIPVNATNSKLIDLIQASLRSGELFPSVERKKQRFSINRGSDCYSSLRPSDATYGEYNKQYEGKTDAVRPIAPQEKVEAKPEAKEVRPEKADFKDGRDSRDYSRDKGDNNNRSQGDYNRDRDYNNRSQGDYNRDRGDYNRDSRDNNRDFSRSQGGEEVVREGLLELVQDSFGFVRVLKYENSEEDAYIPPIRIKKLGLRKGDYLKVHAKMGLDGKSGPATTIDEVNGMSLEEIAKRPVFESLVPIFPNERLTLEQPNVRNDLAIRAIDLVAPIGKGQRAMIVSPPKAGKTTLLKRIANSISVNHPEVKLFVLLIDERPEEVTDMQRSINGEVIYSTFDEQPEHHTKCAEILLERAKRLVELNNDVVILMDSLTRLARAYNYTVAPTGRTLSGGLDPGALYSPKRFFGSARNIEGGGSLTIIATALVDTGSKMDDVIYEEFKGTGNMEIHLDRKLSEKRIFPAIELFRSGTRREDLLMSQRELECAYSIRRLLSEGDTQDAAENIIAMMTKTRTNSELIDMIKNQSVILQKEGFKQRKLN